MADTSYRQIIFMKICNKAAKKFFIPVLGIEDEDYFLLNVTKHGQRPRDLIGYMSRHFQQRTFYPLMISATNL